MTPGSGADVVGLVEHDARNVTGPVLKDALVAELAQDFAASPLRFNHHDVHPSDSVIPCRR